MDSAETRFTAEIQIEGDMEAVLNKCESDRGSWGPAALEQRRHRTRSHLAKIASRREGWIQRNKYYYQLLNQLLRFLVEPQKKVLSVRCGTGTLLAAVAPLEGKGTDICAEIVRPSISQSFSPTRMSSSRLSTETRNSITFSSTISATPWMYFRHSRI